MSSEETPASRGNVPGLRFGGRRRLLASLLPARSALSGPAVKVGLGLVGLALLLGAWALVSALGILPQKEFPAPDSVLSELARLLNTQSLWTAIGDTLHGALLGLAVAVAVGVPLGTLMGMSRIVESALRPTVEFLRPVPGVALVPIAVLIWGQTTTTVWFLVAIGCVWPMLIQAFYAARSLDEVAIDTARSFRLRKRTYLTSVVLPGTAPYLVTGLRVALSISLIVAISVELLIGTPGIGQQIVRAQNTQRLGEMYALIVVSGLLGIAVQVVFNLGERRLLRWHESQRPRAAA